VADSFPLLNREVLTCRLCPRLVSHREEVGRVRRRAYREETYWSKPITGFGDPKARVVIIGLAPGAHGANRTGRVFTGDRSGEFLFRALHEAGFANQPTSTSINDGLELTDAYITCPVRCVPPDNKPLPLEILTCRPYLERELALLKRAQVIVALGRIAFDAYLSLLKKTGIKTACAFGHGALSKPQQNGPALLASYHPSQQNTSTGRLTAAMLRDIFLSAASLLTPRT
jgi:uracil-DNA glycosylase family 4